MGETSDKGVEEVAMLECHQHNHSGPPCTIIGWAAIHNSMS